MRPAFTFELTQDWPQGLRLASETKAILASRAQLLRTVWAPEPSLGLLVHFCREKHDYAICFRKMLKYGTQGHFFLEILCPKAEIEEMLAWCSEV